MKMIEEIYNRLLNEDRIIFIYLSQMVFKEESRKRKQLTLLLSDCWLY